MIHDNQFKYSFSLLYVDYVSLNHKWNYKNVISPYYRLYYIDKGHGEISGITNKHSLEQGFIYLIPSYTLCNLSCDDYLSQYFIQFFEESNNSISLFQNNRTIMKIKASEKEISLFKRIQSLNPGRGINRSDDPSVYEKQTYYKEYQSLNKSLSISHQFENQGIILQLLSKFLNSKYFLMKNSERLPSKIIETMQFIQLNINKPLTIKNLAARANQNTDYFSRQFLEHVGIRPILYIHEKRIERAQYLITTTNKTFMEIASETGFSSVPHFSKIFKNKVNLTPNEYKVQISKLHDFSLDS